MTPRELSIAQTIQEIDIAIAILDLEIVRALQQHQMTLDLFLELLM